MRRFMNLATCLLLVWAPAPVIAHPADAAPSELVRPLSRTTLIVNDLEKSLALFRDVLGMNIITDLQLEGPTVNSLLGTNEKKMRIVILNVAESEIGNIALLVFDDADSEEKHQTKKLPLHPGQAVLVMETLNIDAVEVKARQAGYRIISKPMVIFNRPNMATQSREMIFIGPEGVAINLIERGIPNNPAD